MIRRAAGVFAALCFSLAAAVAGPLAPAMESAMAAHDFSGAVLVVDRGAVVFDKAYGLADRDAALPNRTTTAFRIGALTRLYITAEILALAEKHKIALANTAEQFAPGAGPVTIADLLNRTDAAATPILGQVLAGAAHASLSDALDGVFSRLWMTGSALDTGAGGRRVARSYGGTPPPVVAYSTTRDVRRWTRAFFGGELLSPDSRTRLLQSWQEGPGDAWEATSAEAAFIVQPGIDRAVIVLSNGGSAGPAAIAERLYGMLPAGAAACRGGRSTEGPAAGPSGCPPAIP